MKKSIILAKDKLKSLNSNQREMILIGISIFIILATTLSIAVHKIKSPNSESIPENLSKVEILIEEGDTAWNIQSELTPNSDIREMLYYGKIENGKSLANIQEGEVITFFTDEN